MNAVVLVQPRTEAFDALKRGATMPLSLLSAARRVHSRYNVAIVDQRSDPAWKETLKSALERRPLLVGTTSVTGRQLRHALDISRFVKSVSDVPVVWGGIHASLFPEQTVSEPCVDYVVRGEGEQTLLELADALAAGSNPSAVPGIASKDGSRAALAPPREFLDMDTLEEIPFDLVDPGGFFLRSGRPTAYFETSRGCPNECGYCYNVAYHRRRWRAQGAARVVRRVGEMLDRFPGVRHLSIVDDNYFVDRKRAIAIAGGLAGLGRDLTYQVQGVQAGLLHAMTDAELVLLRRSGLARVDIGAETGSGRLLAAMRKRLDLQDLLALNRRLRRVGIRPWYNFMSGFPGETEADFEATLDLVLRIMRENPDALVSPIYNLAPYPGTEVFEEARRTGARFPDTTEGWADFSLDSSNVPWVDDRARARNAAAYFLSIFVDGKTREYDTFRPLAWAAAAYRPVARWRLKNRRFGLLLEKLIADRAIERLS
ncbi:MAG: B12-binding domain-containing radical SAM protein [Deltaproteobacteria bacterium]|nr:B12-binding domain-containing radical SAM protein [Deltaproteobacteria bacterium]